MSLGIYRVILKRVVEPNEESIPNSDPKPDAAKAVAVEFAKKASGQASALRTKVQSILKEGTFWGDLRFLGPSLSSPDRLTRRMALLFFLSLLGVLGAASVLSYRYWAVKHAIAQKEIERAGLEFEKAVLKTQGEEKRAASVISIGDFGIELQSVDSQSPQRPSANLAEIEVVLHCDSPETKEYIDQNKVVVRDVVTQILKPMEREELMSREGKSKLKRQILKKLNEWLRPRRIEDLFFPKFVFN